MNIPEHHLEEGHIEEGDEITSSVESADRLYTLMSRFPVLPIIIGVLVLIGLALLAFSLGGSNNNPLYPTLPTFTPLSGTISYEAQVVSFTELNADPAAFQGRRLQVSGVYTPLSAPECLDYTGPVIRWSLVADELQLSAIGFENVLRLVDEGTQMTITGTWQLYRGPVGCGKEPVDDTVWYLVVDRILEPNPLQSSIAPALTVIVGTPQFPELPSGTGEAPSIDESVTPDVTDVISPTATLDAFQPTLPGQTPETTPLPVTPLVTPGTPNATTETPDPNATPDLTATFEGSLTPEATDDVGSTPPPGLPTSTPSGPGYPPQGTPPPAGTPGGGYP